MRKLSKSGIFIFMTVIILLQYVSPILAVANTLDEKNDLVSLKSAKVSKEDDQTVTVDLKVTANNVTEQAAKTKIEFSNKAIVFKEALNQLTTSKNQYKLNGQVLEATIAPNTSKEENDLIIKLDKASLKGVDTVQVSSGESKTTLDLSGVTQLSEKSAATPESSAKSTESSTPASSTSSSSSKDETTTKKEATTKEAVGDQNETAKLRSANLKSFDSSLISKENVTGVVQFTTETHMGRISINANKGTVPTPLENAYIEIVIPSEDVDVFEVPPAGIIKKTDRTLNPDGTITIRLDLNKVDSTTTASFPFTVKFKNRVTPNGYSIEPKITLYSGETNNPDAVEASGSLKMETKTLPPSIKKYVFSNSNDAYSQDNIDVYAGVSNEASGEHITSNIQDITFQYAMNTWQPGGRNSNDIDRARSREYDSIVLTDTLPSYTDVNGNIITAKFDPLKNPGWALSVDGKTVTKTITATEFGAYSDAGRLVSDEKLVLTFEGAPFGQKVNTIKADVSINEKSSYETNPTVSDDIKFNLTNDVRLPNGMFDKRLVSSRNVLLEAGQNHLLTSYFRLYVTNKTSLPMSNIVISDTKFDSEFYMQRLSGDSSKIKAVYGIKADGTKELITLSFSTIDSQTSAAVANQVDQVTNHGASPSDQPKIDPVYKALEIQLKDDFKLMPGQALTYDVLMGLNNPYNIEKDISPSKQAYNEAKLNFALNYSDGSQKTYDLGPVKDFATLIPKTEQITMAKYAIGNYQGTVGERIRYQIDLDLGQLFKTRKIKNASIVDLLPAGVRFISTGDTLDKYTLVDNYLNSGRQAIIFNLGDLDLSKMPSTFIRKNVNVEINDKAIPTNRATDDKNNKNYAYFTGDNLDDLVKNNKITTPNTLKDFFDVNGNGDKQEKIIGAERDITVNLPSEIRSLKWIRKEGQTAWIPTGIDIPYNQNFEYNLSTENYGDSLINKLTVYDRLPYNGDKNSSQFENTLRSAIKVPDGFTAYYRTDSATGTPEEEAKSDKWVTSVDDYSKVTAIKVVMKEGTKIQSGSTIDIIVPMTSPKKVNNDLNTKSAINSFYTSRDGEESFGETNKVYDRLPQTLKVKKTWVNGKLDKISVQVYRESNKDFVVKSADLTKDNDYSYEFNDLPGVDEKGNLISDYKVREVINSSNASSEDYDTDISGDQLNGFVISNKLKSTSLSGEKVWSDANNQDGIRPNNVTINLLADGKKIDKQIISDKENWKFSFTNLQKSINGKDIVYSISEESVDKYTPDINDTDKSNIIITNTYTPELVDVKGTKTWDDKDNQDGLRPDKIIVNLMDGETKVDAKEVTSASDWTYSFTGLPKFRAGKAIVYTVSEEKVTGYDATTKGFDLTNTHTPGLTNVTGTKTWDDKDNQDGLRPDKIIVNLKVGDKVVSTQEVTAKDDWKYSFTNLPQFEAGKAIVYTISEEKVADYDTTINGTDLTNTHTPELTEVNGTKTWDDKDNQDGLRPDKIIVNLMDGKTKVDAKEVTSASDWKYSFTNLPKFRAGKTIVYTVSEEKVTAYDVTVKGYDLTNAHAVELTDVTGTKTWDDKDNQDGLRPDKIIVNLKVGDKVISTKDVTAKDDWKYSFDKLPKFEAGKAIVYTVSEEKVTDYDTAINGTDLTNTHTPELTEVKGTKTWDDKDNQDGLRPDKIIVNLMDGEVKVASKEVTSESNWTYSFTDLPKFKAGKAIDYTVTENSMDNYKAKITGFDITNSYTPGKTSVTVTKVWDDSNDQDGLRPKSIQVQLYANDKPSGDPVTLDSDNKWMTTFTDLDLKTKGQLIDYKVKEVDKVSGYQTTIDDSNKGNVLITNSHKPNLTAFNGTKTWSDSDNQDGLRPTSITVNLLADGKKVGQQVVTADTKWTYSFTGFPQFSAGKPIKYTVSEEKVVGYDTTINGYDITNSHTPELIEVNGTKSWNDNNNQDGIRPTSIKVNLLANGKIISFKEVKSTDNWQYKFISLPKFEAGKAIIYTVSEEKVMGYDVAVNGVNLTNTHAPELTAVNGTKTWSDNDNQDGIRPDKITVNLLADGKQVATKDVTAKDDWKYSFANLPKFAAGKAIVYTVSEAKVTGYDVTVNGTDLTNTHTPEMIAVNGTKTWSDNDNQDGIRPDKITVNLLADGKQVATKDVTAKDNWKYSFANLPKFAAGKAIVYTVSEATVTGYDVTFNGTDLTNTHTPEMIAVNGTKTWSDNDNQDGIRPDKITVNLLADGKQVATKDVTAKDDWKYSFANLPKFAAGKAIVYTVSEATVTGYDTTVNGYDLTNYTNYT